MSSPACGPSSQESRQRWGGASGCHRRRCGSWVRWTRVSSATGPAMTDPEGAHAGPAEEPGSTDEDLAKIHERLKAWQRRLGTLEQDKAVGELLYLLGIGNLEV